jgi:hypothetical protein
MECPSIAGDDLRLQCPGVATVRLNRLGVLAVRLKSG